MVRARTDRARREAEIEIKVPVEAVLLIEQANLLDEIPPECHQVALDRVDISGLLSLLERAQVPARHTPTPGDSDS